MTAALRELVATAPNVAALQSLATTTGGRDVWLLQIAAAGELPFDQRPALLVVGGIDAEVPAGSETALRVAQRLLSDSQAKPDGDIAKMLKRRTLYVFPRLNPDGIEAYFAPVRWENRRNATPVNDDRDGRVDEDPPNDLNGDGLIGVLRVPDPDGAWMVDPDEPRLLKRADPAQGQRGAFKLISEGSDDDGDGKINEDPPGGVDDDRNWPHFFEAGAAGAGVHQLCEPETRALAEFVVNHPRIAGAVVYGRNDNIVTLPRGTQRGPEGQSYRDLHPEDLKIYEYVSERFRKITGLTGSVGCAPEGTLYAWLYAQRGIPTFATSLWWPLEPAPAAAAPVPSTQADSQPAGQPTTQPSADEGGGPQAELRGPGPGQARRALDLATGAADGGPNAGPESFAARVESSDLLKRWLKYSDAQRGGAGFMSWSALAHPALGKVELGGLTPYFTTTPPAEELEPIADAQVRFLAALSDMLPAPRFSEPLVRDVGGGVWEVEVRLENRAYLPTHLASARQIGVPALVVRPLVPKERRLGGPALRRVENLPGSGGAAALRWLIRGAAGETVDFTAFSRVHGELKTSVVLRESDKEGK